MLLYFWNEYLFRPIFNLLIYLYNETTGQNFGLAIIYLTILLRAILLPFSIINIWKEKFYEKVTKEISKIAIAYKNDPVLQNQEIREFLKTHKINPWAKAVVFGVQALTLILLYQVFLGGIKGHKFDLLYPGIERPDFVNTMFLGFDLGAKSLFWSAVVAIMLYLEIAWIQRKKKSFLLNSDIVYKYFFPLFVFAVLYFLPMVKSLFILTSLLFSIIVVGGVKLIFNALNSAPKDE